MSIFPYGDTRLGQCEFSAEGVVSHIFQAHAHLAFRPSGTGGTGDLPISAAAPAVSLGGESFKENH